MQVTGLRPKIVAAADGRGVVGHAGARLLADLADATGLSAAFSDALGPLRVRQSGHDPGRVAVDLAVMLADGGEAIADLAAIEIEIGFARAGALLAPAARQRLPQARRDGP